MKINKRFLYITGLLLIKHRWSRDIYVQTKAVSETEARPQT